MIKVAESKDLGRAKDPIMEIKNIVLRFGGVVALQDISFDIFEGEIRAIIGPNGAGKTTLFDVISGLTASEKGRIYFNGNEITKSPPHKRCHVGIARTFQLNAAFETLTVRENTLASSYFGHSNQIFPGYRFSKD